jgi:hypothetical protein
MTRPARKAPPARGWRFAADSAQAAPRAMIAGAMGGALAAAQAISRRLAGSAAVVILAMMLVPVASASAATHVLDFESLAGGSIFTNQDPTVTFGVPAGAAVTNPPLVIAVPAARAHSGTKVAELSHCSGGGEICNNRTDARLTFQAARVSMYVGTVAPAAASVPITLTAYDIHGNALGSNTVQVGPTVGTRTQLAFADFQFTSRGLILRTDIAGFTISSTANVGQLAFDDVSYDIPDTPTSPDFQLNRDDTGEAVMVPDGAANVGLTLQRLAASSGTISLSASGLPTGVQASFSPAAATGSSATTQINLHLVAAANAPRGAMTATVTATPSSASAGAVPRSVSVGVRVTPRFDLRADGIDVTQGSQYGGYLVPAGLDNGNGAYRGVQLVRGGKTIVRFYVDSDIPVRGDVGVELRGFDEQGNPLDGGPLFPDYGGMVTNPEYPFVGEDVRDSSNPYTFTLPASWTDHDHIKLVGTVIPPHSFAGDPQLECTGAACAANNTFTLNNVRFVRVRPFDVYPVAILDYNTGDWPLEPGAPFGQLTSAQVPTPAQVFAKAAVLSPEFDGGFRIHIYQDVINATQTVSDNNAELQRETVAAGQMRGYDLSDPTVVQRLKKAGILNQDGSNGPDGAPNDAQGHYNINNARVIKDLRDRYVIHGTDLNTQLTNLVKSWDDSHGHPGDTVSGIQSEIDCCSQQGGRVSHVQAQRPVTAVAHELFHSYGRRHSDAGTNLGGCGGTADPNAPDPLGNNPMGLLQGIGLDRSSSPDRIIGNLTPVGAGALGTTFDLMSYCARGDESRSWVSPANWDGVVDFLRRGAGPSADLAGAAPPAGNAAAATGARFLHVTAHRELDGKTTIDSVSPVSRALPSSGRNVDVTAVARSAGGSVLAHVPVKAVMTDTHPTPAAIVYTADLSAVHAASIQIVGGNGAVLATKARSAHAPKVRILWPTPGTHVRAHGTVTLRWRATDADRNELSVEVDYSRDGGRSWKTILQTGNLGHERLPVQLFAGTHNARLRFRANDGFIETAALSGRFRADGTAPQVTISSPGPRTSLRADGLLYLSGAAQDDTGRFLPGNSLRWFLGRQLLGKGERMSVSGLSAGVRTVRLVARDGHGRTAAATVRIRLISVRPVPIRLTLPSRISPRAKRFTFRISLSVPAVLSGPGVRASLPARRLRTVSVRIKPGRRVLTLTLRLAAGRQTSQLHLSIAR